MDTRIISFSLLCFLNCACKSEREKNLAAFITPGIDSLNNIRGLNERFTDYPDTIRKWSHFIDSFSVYTKPHIQINAVQAGYNINITVPFSYNDMNGLALTNKCLINFRMDSILSADCYLYGDAYPNAGLSTAANYYLKDNILSVTSSHTLQWRLIRIESNGFKKNINPDFRLQKKLEKMPAPLFWKTTTTAPVFVMLSGVNSAIAIGTELRFDVRKKKAILKVFKNGKTILNYDAALNFPSRYPNAASITQSVK